MGYGNVMIEQLGNACVGVVDEDMANTRLNQCTMNVNMKRRNR